MTREEADALLGAWALDAVDTTERSEVDTSVSTDPALGRAALAMQRAVALLGEQDAATAPAALRERLLAEVRRRPAATHVTPSAPLDVLARQVDVLRELLDSLGPDDWAAPAKPYAWNVHGLVAHLLVSERYTAHKLGLERFDELVAGGSDGEVDHLSLGADVVSEELHRDPHDTARSWHERATATVAEVATWHSTDHERAVTYHGWPFAVDSVLITRGFETWTHADDIRRATSRPVDAPPPADLRAMSTFSVNSLPLLVPELASRSARIVLTGAGGGTFDVGNPSAGSDLTFVADVVDYCRVVARRVDPEGLHATIEGEPALAGALLDAARVFAM